MFSLSSWLKAAQRKARTRRAGRRPERLAPGRFVPRLEALEDRTVLSTLTVTSAADDGSSGTLRAVIASAHKGDTIVFDPSLDGQTITLTQGQLAIKKSLDIEGPGASQLSISGNSASRVFAISNGPTVTVAGLTIANGLADQGGGIDNQGALTLSYDVLSGNQALGDSSTTGLGGGLFSEAHASVSVAHSTFLDNQAVGNVGVGWGGGLMNEGSASVTDSSFTGNQATGGTGSIDKVPGGGFGGGVASAISATLSVDNSTFTGNQAIDGSGQYGFAGAVGSVLNSSLTVSNSSFSGNQALANSSGATSGGFAGAVGNGSGQNSDSSTLTVTGSSFSNNLASGFFAAAGGAVQNGPGDGPVTISYSVFSNNQAIGSGSGAY